MPEVQAQVVEQPIDFQMAEAFLKVARSAHEAGDEKAFTAARTLVVLNLGLTSGNK